MRVMHTCLIPEVRQYCLSEQFGLPGAVIPPDLEHVNSDWLSNDLPLRRERRNTRVSTRFDTPAPLAGCSGLLAGHAPWRFSH